VVPIKSTRAHRKKTIGTSFSSFLKILHVKGRARGEKRGVLSSVVQLYQGGKGKNVSLPKGSADPRGRVSCAKISFLKVRSHVRGDE